MNITNETLTKFNALCDAAVGCHAREDNSEFMAILETLTPFEIDLFALLIKYKPTAVLIYAWVQLYEDMAVSP